jgi:hypothetical protein
MVIEIIMNNEIQILNATWCETYYLVRLKFYVTCPKQLGIIASHIMTIK